MEKEIYSMDFFIAINWLHLYTSISYFAYKYLVAVPSFTYQVYVVELSKKVFTENWRFRAANPQFNGVLECLYVGMTSKTPQERLKQHKTGYINQKGYKISAYIVQKYGRYLRPSLYEHINNKPMNREQALIMEEKLAWDLRRQGYAVWFN
jgi:hypothetical protein